jgi:GDSL-like lipase/acylhydrolase family protein
VRASSSALLPRVLLALAGTVLAAAGAEALLRRLAPERPSFYTADPAALYRLRPGTRARYHYPWMAPGEEVEVAINGRGFRGAELAARKTGQRVVVYGDSFVEARSTRIEDTFPVRLGAALAERGLGPVEVVNAGVSGYGPDQVLARLDAELLELRPDLVILALYAGNDWGDLVRDQIFTVDGGGRLARGWPVLDAALRTALEERRGWRALATVRAASRLWTELAAPAPAAAAEPPTTQAVLRDCEREYADALGHPGRVTNLFRDHYDADLSVRPRSESAVYKRRMMAAVLAEVGRLAAVRSVPLLLVAIPAGSDIAPNHPHRIDATRFPEYRAAALTDGVEQIAAPLRLPLVNLFGPFAERRDRVLYYPIDGHWNVAAQALAARLTAERIAADGLLP